MIQLVQQTASCCKMLHMCIMHISKQHTCTIYTTIFCKMIFLIHVYMYYTVTILLGRLTENGIFFLSDNQEKNLKEYVRNGLVFYYMTYYIRINNRNISLIAIRLSGALCMCFPIFRRFQFIRILCKSQSNYDIWNSTDTSTRFQGP